MRMIPTGYKDKHGKDICVGDTVKFKTKRLHTSRGIVIERFFGYVILDKDTTPQYRTKKVDKVYHFTDVVECEVIPELKGEN